ETVSSSGRISMTSSASSTSRGTTSCLTENCFRSGLPNRWPPSSSASSSGLAPLACGASLLLEVERRRVMASGTVVVVGGTRGLGRAVAQFYAGQGKDVVVTGRDAATAGVCASEIGG